MSYHLTMLACDMNDQPVSFGHGAPLRLGTRPSSVSRWSNGSKGSSSSKTSLTSAATTTTTNFRLAAVDLIIAGGGAAALTFLTFTMAKGRVDSQSPHRRIRRNSQMRIRRPNVRRGRDMPGPGPLPGPADPLLGGPASPGCTQDFHSTSPARRRATDRCGQRAHECWPQTPNLPPCLFVDGERRSERKIDFVGYIFQSLGRCRCCASASMQGEPRRRAGGPLCGDAGAASGLCLLSLVGSDWIWGSGTFTGVDRGRGCDSENRPEPE